MKLLQTEFFKELSTVILGTLLFTANCAFVFLPSALGRIPGQPLASPPASLQQADNAAASDRIQLAALPPSLSADH